jgi:hypothetical protein
MSKQDISFSIGDFDANGDVFEKGIYFHFGDTRIKMSDTLDELKELSVTIQEIVTEIEENWCYE